jgi:hypothetical protein
MSFTRLDPTDFVVSADSITAPAWSNNVTTLTSFFTATSGTSSYYVSVYDGAVTSPSASVQFAVAYGHALGSGSLPLNSLVPGISPTRINFGQYRNLIYGDAETPINFGGSTSASLSIAVIQVDRNRYKEALFPGTFNLTLTNGASGTVKLTDNSKDVTTVTYVDGGRLFDIVSGSNGTAINSPIPTGASAKGYTSAGSYGFYLPDMGLIVLNPAALGLISGNGGIGLSFSATNTQAAGDANNRLIYTIINTGASFQLNSQETISSDYVFVRVKNGDYNYTTNPSFITGSGELIYSNFINSPQTYPTSVGLYNDNNELLAVAKMSKALVKDFTKEALIRVKLDW